jgi:hypothetical protein
VERHPDHDVAHRHAEHQCRHEPAHEQGPVPDRAPGGIFDLAAELEAHRTQDQRQQDQQHGQIEAGEADRVENRERGKDRAAAGDQPHLIALPDRADHVEGQTALGVGAGHGGQQRAHAQVKAVGDGEADQQDAQQQPPDQAQGVVVERNRVHCWMLWGRQAVGEVARALAAGGDWAPM